ncbi:DUF2218 domain-containing protein [Streptomyces sp. NPDC097610]|uniref:DUF2218 domain-containing protein n=1 Tax=Streptomyces sp. NPDC097610 TaxID=3157227 RepID=UPI003326451C
MVSAEARVETGRPSRYLVQLCKHFDNKGRHLGHRPRAHDGDGDAAALQETRAVAARAEVEWSETEGTVVLPWGRCALRARPGALAVRVEAADEENLRRLQELVGGHVERFGRRERLTVEWRGGQASTAVPGSPARGAASTSAGAVSATGGGVTRRQWAARTTAVAAVGVLTVAVHLGPGAVLFAHWRWTGWVASLVLAVVLVKITVRTGLGRFAVRLGRASIGRASKGASKGG